MKKVRTDKLKKFFEKLPRNLAEHAFRSFMPLVVFALIFGGILFYKYSILIEKKEPQISKQPIQFKKEVLENVSNKWIEREIKFNETDTKEYPDLFEKELSLSEEE